jgi:hypothetical protein
MRFQQSSGNASLVKPWLPVENRPFHATGGTAERARPHDSPDRPWQNAIANPALKADDGRAD